MQTKGMPLAEVALLLCPKENVLFDDIWSAVMSKNMVSEKAAIQVTKEWCGHYKDR